MTSAEDNIINDLVKIINGYHGDSYYVIGNISQKRLASSTKFHGVDPRDTVLVVLDSTVMGTTSLGSAENGMSITLRGIYWKNMWAVATRKNSYSWEELTKLYKNIEVRSGNIIFEPGIQFSIPANYDGKALLNLIKSLVEFFIESTNMPYENKRDNQQPVTGQNTTQEVKYIEAKTHETGAASNTILNVMALCCCHSGEPDEKIVDMAAEFINADGIFSLTSDKNDIFMKTIEEISKDSMKSKAFLKLRQNKILGDCISVDLATKEQLTVAVEAFIEASEGEPREKIAEIWSRILPKL